MTEEYDSKWWDDMWKGADVIETPPDDVLVSHVKGLAPGRALELGCGAGANAVWLAEQGWTVEAVDFSEEAVNLGKRLASKRGVAVDFHAGDATTFMPNEPCDLIISFYIHLWPGDRARMFANARRLLAPGGRLLFVSHDKSDPPPNWTSDEFDSLTTPNQVVSELEGLDIKVAEVVRHDEAPHMRRADESHAHYSQEHSSRPGSDHGHSRSGSTVVLAVKPDRGP